MRIIAAALAAALCAGCAHIEHQLATDAAALTSEHFKATATLKDDTLDTVATISTRAGHDTRGGLVRLEWSDAYLRGFVSKGTGALSVQVVIEARYLVQWRFYNVANFAAPSGPQQRALTQIGREVQSCNPACSYWEMVGFTLTEQEARAIAKMPDPVWKMKLQPRAGEDLFVELQMAELRGLLARVDDYRAKR